MAAKVIPAFTVESSILATTTAGGSASTRRVSEGISLHDDDLGVMEKAIHRGAGEQVIGEEPRS